MIMQEHDNNRFSKENDSVEEYLKRVIQRYFETEKTFTETTIESIILESLTRFKRYIKNRGEDFLLCVNNQTGHVGIDIESLGGQIRFDHKQAYNADFGTEPGTVCEGNDIRLSNAREAFEHKHSMNDIQGINEFIEEIKPYLKIDEHYHYNDKALNVLRYSGSKQQIDLIQLENSTVQQNDAVRTVDSALQTFLIDYKYAIDNIGNAVLMFQRRMQNFIESVDINISQEQNNRYLINQWLNKADISISSESVKILTKSSIDKITDILNHGTEFVNSTNGPTEYQVSNINYVVVNDEAYCHTYQTFAQGSSNDFFISVTQDGNHYFDYSITLIEDGQEHEYPLPHVITKNKNVYIINAGMHGTATPVVEVSSLIHLPCCDPVAIQRKVIAQKDRVIYYPSNFSGTFFSLITLQPIQGYSVAHIDSEETAQFLRSIVSFSDSKYITNDYRFEDEYVPFNEYAESFHTENLIEDNGPVLCISANGMSSEDEYTAYPFIAKVQYQDIHEIVNIKSINIKHYKTKGEI